MLIAKGRERQEEKKKKIQHGIIGDWGGLIVDTSIFIYSTDNFNYLLL